MPHDKAAPLPEREYDAEADTWASWWEAHAVIGERVKAGEPIPDMFKPRERIAKAIAQQP